MSESPIAKFARRMTRAENPKDPFPMDRVFASNVEMAEFNAALRDYMTDSATILEELSKARAQLQSMQV